MPESVQERTISHTGSDLGDANVTTQGNQISPQMETPVISFECPREYDWIHYNGPKHPTRFVPRRVQSFTGTTGDDTTQTLDNDIQPVAGEKKLDKQEFEAVIAADHNGNEVDISSIDYSANSVTLAQDPASGNTWYLYPVISEGTINARGVNQFDQTEGFLTEWGAPLYRFSDFPQLKRGTKINLDGEVRWSRYERLEFTIDSPYQVVWSHANWPRGAFVSQFEQDVDIKL